MKIIALELCNFRQFYGKTPNLKFASKQANTTIIHGNNGAGKTTILNAFTWVLYNKFTAAFASPEHLVNKKALFETSLGNYVECSVKIQFEHDAKEYSLQRKCYVYKNKNNQVEYGETILNMLISGEDGRWYHPTESPQDIINSILPESLHQYFFFDGERIDHLSRSEQKSTLAEDTKELIGVKLIDRSIEHLKKARRKLQEELTAIGDTKTQKILQEQTRLEKRKDEFMATCNTLENELKEYGQLKKSLNEQLLDLNGAEEMQKNKLELETQIKKTKQYLSEINQTIKDSISHQGFQVFLSEAIHKFTNILDGLRERGELPSGIKQQFIAELLKRQECICGQDLNSNREAYQKVEAWMNKAGVAEVEETAIRLETKVHNVTQTVEKFWQDFDHSQARMNQARQELANLENRLDDVKAKLRNYPEVNIQQLQVKLDDVEEKIKQITLNLGANNQEINSIEQEIEKNNQTIQKYQAKEAKQQLAKRRIEASEEVISRMEQVKHRLEKQFRLSLEQRIQEIFSDISFTPYFPRINENYELNLFENTTGRATPVPASTGENQILSLSFIGGIIDRVREWSEQNTLMGPNSSTFPIVMDSPFGSLDEIYRRQVAKSITRLANQLIVLVTKTQWRTEVETQMQDYIGQQYILVYHSPKSDCQEDFITIEGKTYPLVKKSPSNFEYTEVIAI